MALRHMSEADIDLLSKAVLLVTICEASNCMSSRHSENVIIPRASVPQSIPLNRSL